MEQLLVRKNKGQGLVEYALIIVLMAIVVIVALQALGPTVGNVFSTITDTLIYPGVIQSASANATGGIVTITVTVSQPTTINITGSVTGGGPCSGTCQFTFPDPGGGAAAVTATDGGTKSVSW
jgi:pilus assembly protein Flp/PilA